jgi:single-strand DNA-binding protein
VAWEEIAEAASERLQKGSPVIVEGRLQTRSWDGADGAKRRTTEVVATSLTPA